MKPCLPLILRRYLLSAMASAMCITCSDFAYAGLLHTDVSITTYTDFGQNFGRYAVGNTNALLNYLNKDGVKITYTGGQADYTMEHGMIDFSSQNDGGYGLAIGYNFYSTVQHNATHNNTYAGNYIGESNAIHYQGIEYRASDVFLMSTSGGSFAWNFDYKLTRQSKLLTDVTGSTVYDGEYSVGQMVYRAGSGRMQRVDYDGTQNHLIGGYGYITGGVASIVEVKDRFTNGNGVLSNRVFAIETDWSSDGINDENPLPFAIQGGDSGSPSWVWNEKTGQYEYAGTCSQTNYSSNGRWDSNAEYSAEQIDKYNKTVSFGSDNTVYINAVETKGEGITDGTYTATPYRGTVTDSSGETITDFVGVKSGINTWKDLSALKDTNNWYSYDATYLNASNSLAETTDGVLNYADLYMTENLVFTASSSSETQNIIMNADVDLGLGYAQFSLGEGQESASFRLTSKDGSNYLLHSAGFVVDQGVSLTVDLTNPSDYMREWRKIGNGDLHIVGSGDNDIFLNVGGMGAGYGASVTYLERDGGYAAYNVLINNGATLVIKDTSQIKRDFTFGYRGGYLDMNGNSMTWNNDNDASADGFTIHALDEGARITNSSDTAVTLTWTQSGAQTWLGSFVDQDGKGALKFIYNGGEGASLTMHSIYTNLSNEGSGITVQSGTLALEGTNTVHGYGSLTGTSRDRYSSEDDWHYADTASDVTVQNDGTFRLGSHARLTGDVTVEGGGTFVMNEGVRHQYEYIEGGYTKEDTNAISDFFGLKGNISLAETADLKIQFSEGTDSTLVYGGKITGKGNASLDLGINGTLKLSGENSFSGTKKIESGILTATANTALGDISTNKWIIGEKGVLSSFGFTAETGTTGILQYIDGSSSGVLALTSDIKEQFDLSNHKNLIIGALAGHSVQYGTTDAELAAVDGSWTLGGGGGELIVNFKLTGNNNLTLGNKYCKGSVHLANSNNDFTGSITLAGGVTLSYANGALGAAHINANYTNRVELIYLSDFSSVESTSNGVVLIDQLSGCNFDLTKHQSLYLGTQKDITYSGTLTVAEGAAYRLGGSTGTLTLASELASGHDLILDAQTFQGGRIILSQAQNNLDGNVTVMGYDSTLTNSTLGDITLEFKESDSLSHASHITLKNGGNIELAGTSQTLNNLNAEAGSSITDSTDTKASVLTLNISDSEALANGTIRAGSILKNGEGTLNLGGTVTYDTMTVQQGTLTLQSDTSTAAEGSLTIKSGTTLDLNGHTANGSIHAEDGSTIQGSGAISSSLNMASGRTVTVNNNGSQSLSVAQLNTETDSRVNIEMGNNTFSITELNGNGSVTLNTTLNDTGTTAITIDSSEASYSGHLTINGADKLGTRIQFKDYNSFGTGTVTINGGTFWIASANSAETAVTATIDVGEKGATINGSSGRHYYFTDLSGHGELYTCLDGGSVTFGGDVSNFSGAIDSSRGHYTFAFGGEGKSYHDIIGNSTEEAVNLFGANADGTAAVRLSSNTADNLHITYKFQYTDDVILNASLEKNSYIEQNGTGTLVLNQTNTFTGTKTINSGTVFATTKEALGDVSSNKWIIGKQGILRSNGFDGMSASEILTYIDSTSTGVLALSSDVDKQFDLSKTHNGLIIGVAEGCTVQYGTAGTTDTLNAVNGAWTLGGGGGELIVHFKLTGNNNLILGNEYGNGVVHLTNTGNDFTGNIVFAGGVTLCYEKGALGNQNIDLSYTNRITLLSNDASNLSTTSQGVIIVDKLGNQNIDLSSHSNMFLGANEDTTYTGTITLADDADYRFGGSSGTLTVASQLQSEKNMILDGQNYEGGKLVFSNQQEDFNGEIVIRGYDAYKTKSTNGSATLGFAQDDTLQNAATITVQDGGIIDLSGTNQTLNNVSTTGSGILTDSSSNKNGVLTLNNTKDTNLNGSIDVANLVKTGNGTIQLGGNNTYETFTVKEGSVNLADGNALSTNGTLVVENGGTLTLNGKSSEGTVVLNNGSTLEGNGTLSGMVCVKSGNTASMIVSDSGKTTTFECMQLESDGTLNANIGSNNISINSLKGNGNIAITTTQTSTISGSNTDFTGNVTINGNGGINSAGIRLTQHDSLGNGTLTVNGGSFYVNAPNSSETAVTATINVGEKGAWMNGNSGATYYFSGLSGSGTLYTYLYLGGTTWFQGDMTEFSGTMSSVNRDNNSSYSFGFGGDGVNYHTTIGATTDEAVNLFGDNANLKTDNGNILTYNFQYSDDVIANAVISGKSKVTQSGNGTLILNQENTYTGVTTVSAGTLAVTGSVGTSSSDNEYVVSSHGKLALRENGAIANKGVTVQNTTATQGISLCSADVDDSDGFLQNITMTDAGISATDTSERGTLNNVTVTVTSDSYDISDSNLSGSGVMATSSLTLTNVSMDADSFVCGIEETATSAELSHVSLSVTEDAILASDVSAYDVGEVSVYVYKISNFDNVTLGGSITLDLTDLEDKLTMADTIIAIDFGENVTLKDGFTVTASYNNATYTSDLLTQGNQVVLISASDAVPEPTTPALIFIGLAAGALRRRRVA